MSKKPFKNTSDKIISGSHIEIKVWDVASGTCLRILLGHSDYVRSIIKLSDDQIAN